MSALNIKQLNGCFVFILKLQQKKSLNEISFGFVAPLRRKGTIFRCLSV